MSAIQGTAANVVGGAAGSNRFNELSSEDFMQIIFTELQQQDPFEPNDSSALLEQLNSIRAIESDIELTKNLEDIVFQNQLAGAGNLIGRYVQGMAPGGNRVDGQVISVIRQGDMIGVELDTGWIIDVDQVELIVDESLFDDGTGGDNPFNGSGLTDVNGDGIVDGTDLSLLLGQWSDWEENGSNSGDGSSDSDATDGADDSGESEGTDDSSGSDDSGDEG